MHPVAPVPSVIVPATSVLSAIVGPVPHDVRTGTAGESELICCALSTRKLAWYTPPALVFQISMLPGTTVDVLCWSTVALISDASATVLAVV